MRLKRCHADLVARHDNLDQKSVAWISETNSSLLKASGIGRRAFDMAVKASNEIKEVNFMELSILSHKNIIAFSAPTLCCQWS